MKTPIIVFADDLFIFKTLEKAEAYFESLDIDEIKSSFDAEGHVLVAVIVKRSGTGIFGYFKAKDSFVSFKETGEFQVEVLKSKLLKKVIKIEHLISKDVRFSQPEIANKNLEDIINLLLEIKIFNY